MKELIFIITVIFAAVNGVPQTYSSKKALLEDQKLHCDSLCTTYDGIFEFKDKLKTCICYVGKYFDDMEVSLMRKNAKAMGMNLKTIKTTPKIVSKRETLETTLETTTETPKKKLFGSFKKPASFNSPKEKQSLTANMKFQLPQSKFSQKKKEATNQDVQNIEEDRKDSIVGARANPGAISINSRANSRPTQHNSLQPQSNPLQNLQPGAMKDVWMKARQRLDHLITHSDGGRFNSRFAQSETQAIRNVLKPLTLRSKSGSSKSAVKPLSGQGTRNSGLMGGLSKNSQGLKISGNPLKSGTAKLKPFQSNNKPSLNPVSGGLLSNNNKNGPISNLFKSSGSSQVKTRMNGHSLVGASGPLETAEGVPSDSTKEQSNNVKVDIVVEKKTNKVGVNAEQLLLKEGNKKEAMKNSMGSDLGKSDVVVQPENSLMEEGDFMEE